MIRQKVAKLVLQGPASLRSSLARPLFWVLEGETQTGSQEYSRSVVSADYGRPKAPLSGVPRVYLQVGVQRGLQEAVAPHVAAQQQQGRGGRRHHALPVEMLASHGAKVYVLASDNLAFVPYRPPCGDKKETRGCGFGGSASIPARGFSGRSLRCCPFPFRKQEGEREPVQIHNNEKAPQETRARSCRAPRSRSYVARRNARLHHRVSRNVRE